MQINRKLSADIPGFAGCSRCVERIGATIRVQRASRARTCARRIIRARPTCEESSIFFFLFWSREATQLVRRFAIKNNAMEQYEKRDGRLTVVPVLHAKFIPMNHAGLIATEYTRQGIIAISFDERTSNESR